MRSHGGNPSAVRVALVRGKKTFPAGNSCKCWLKAQAELTPSLPYGDPRKPSPRLTFLECNGNCGLYKNILPHAREGLDVRCVDVTHAPPALRSADGMRNR